MQSLIRLGVITLVSGVLVAFAACSVSNEKDPSGTLGGGGPDGGEDDGGGGEDDGGGIKLDGGGID